MLLVSSPLLVLAGLMVLVDWPLDTFRGLASIASGRDLVQAADGEKTAVTLELLIGLIWLALWLLHVQWVRRLNFAVLLYGALLAAPLLLVAGVGTNYLVEWVLDLRGYEYCTYHVLGTRKGAHGTHVYVKRDLPGACDQAKAVFPPGRIVEGNTGALNLPAVLQP